MEDYKIKIARRFSLFLIKRIRQWLYMSRRVGTFSLYRRRGLSDQEAMEWVNTIYPASEEQMQYEDSKTLKLQRKYEQR